MQRAVGVGVLALAAALGLLLSPRPVHAGDHEEKIAERIEDAAKILDEILAAPDKGLPQDLLDRSMCVIVIPSMKKGGLGLGGRYGRGLVSCRRDGGGGGWGPPSMMVLSGGSIGLQLGFTAIDVVMLVLNEDGMRLLLKSKFTLGGDASVAAGPVGRAGTAETDALMTAKILTWSRSKGLFAGLELKGAVLKADEDANEVVYGKRVAAKRLLLRGAEPIPAIARPFVTALGSHSPHRSK